ncbi:hypothetical protein V5O48_010928 [Marasmius crinis-equi]|uniref:Uncharacterized protein n=1 Tax=Marasmius crinis-equi TaxID=585013 RepID=A0ABR3F720_9AGAR
MKLTIAIAAAVLAFSQTALAQNSCTAVAFLGGLSGTSCTGAELGDASQNGAGFGPCELVTNAHQCIPGAGETQETTFKRTPVRSGVVIEVLACFVGINKQIDCDRASSGVLGIIGQVRDLMDNGLLVINSWIMHLIRAVILQPDLPSPVEGVDARNRTLAYIQELLDFSLDEKVLWQITRSFSTLWPLLMEAWCKAVNETHPTAGLWSRLMAKLAWGPTRACVLVPYNSSQTRASFQRNVYGEGTELSLMFIRYLSYAASRIPTMSVLELDNVRMFLAALAPGKLLRHHPLFPTAIKPQATPALVSVVRSLLSTRTVDRLSPDGIGFRTVHGSVCLCLAYLATMGNRYPFILGLLDAGIIPARRCLLIMDAGSPTPAFVGYACEILDFISRLMIYQPIFHAFLLSIRRVPDLESAENEIKEHATTLWRSWERTRDKALILRELRRDLKKGLSFQCSNRKCPLLMPSDEENCGNLKTLTNLRDMPIIYEHMSDSIPISDYDIQCIYSWVALYFDPSIPEITNQILTHCSELSQRADCDLLGEERLIKSGFKNPIMIADSTGPGLGKPEEIICFTVPARLKEEGPAQSCPGTMETISSLWDSWEGSGEKLLFVVLIPVDQSTAWMLYERSRFSVLLDRCADW